MQSKIIPALNDAAFGVRPYVALLVIGSLAFALAACSKQEEPKTAGQQVDAAIAKTQQAAADAKVKAEGVMSDAGTAIKSASEDAESSAKRAAAKIEGTFDDVAVTTSVSSAIAKESDLSVFNINVDTKNGVVTLNGSVPTQAGRDKAGTIAKVASGVYAVENKLTVKPD